MTEHVHRLTTCGDCGGEGIWLWHEDMPICEHCDGRGYYEFCSICGEPMGNRRRKWKREQREHHGG